MSKQKGKSKKKIIIPVIVIMVLIIAAGVVIFLRFNNNKGKAGREQDFQEVLRENNIDAVTAYGVINIDSVEETLEIENMTTNLVIEEVLFSTGDYISEGDALVKLNADSVAEAGEELEKTLRGKDLAYRSGKIEYEQNLISAKYDYDSTILKGEQADEVYKETVQSLKNTLESSKKTYEDAKEQLAKYLDAQENNTYYTDYNVEEYKRVYDDNYQVLIKKMEEWGVPWSDVTGKGARITEDTYSQYKYVLQMLYSILETNLKEYETALEKYETDNADLSYNLLSLKLNMSTLEETYQNAQKSYETSLLSAEKTKQTAKTNAELAQSEYEAKVDKAEADFEALKSAFEEAQNDYDTFKSSIVDNVYLAGNSGKVLRTSARTNGRLSAGGRILTYADQTKATVSVSVDQKDIAKLSVGDTAVCYSEDTGMLNGTIVSISPVTQSSSMSSVTYSVTVRLESSGDMLPSNTTVTVLFGIDMSALSGVSIPTQDSESGGFGDFFGGGEAPDMNSFFGNGEMPDMSNFGGGGVPGRGSRR